MAATKNAVQQQYAGPTTSSKTTLLAAAFGISGALSTQDLLQIVDPVGKVVYSIDSTGTANDNPSTPSGTAVLGQFQAHTGSTRAQYVASAFANPSNLDIIQVVQPGGNVAYYIDYQGVTHTNGVS